MAEPEKILKRIGIFALGVLVVVYVSKQLMNLLDSSLQTEAAFAVTYEQKLEADCYIMRDETVLTSSNPGLMYASANDAARIAKGQEAVRVYSRENDVSTESLIRDIDAKLDVLEKSSIDTAYASADITKMDEEIGSLLESAAVFSSDNDLVGAVSKKDAILIEMNKRWLISNPNESFSDRVTALTAEKVSLKSKLSGTSSVIYAPESGYYFSTVDGYENIFSSDKISSLTVEEFRKMTESEPEIYSQNVAGKLVTDYTWYIACPVSSKEAAYFDVGNEYSVDFTYSYGTVLDMSLVSKIGEGDGQEVILVFSSTYMPDGFEYTRKQKVSIVYKEYSGLKIPKDSVRILGDMKGVYVMRGTQIEFRLVNEIYSVDDYYIIDSDADNYPRYERSREYYTVTDKNGVEQTQERISYYQPLSLYDLVITSGTQVYDGMKVE